MPRNKHGYIGVYKYKNGWKSQLNKKFLGYYDSKIKAAVRRDAEIWIQGAENEYTLNFS